VSSLPADVTNVTLSTEFEILVERSAAILAAGHTKQSVRTQSTDPLGRSQMDTSLINHATQPGKPRFLDRTRIAKTWEQYYQDRGYGLWGLSPSPTAKILAKAILDGNPGRSERVQIVDWGCGYGRDSLYFLELGFDVIGIDLSEKAIALAREAYKQRQASSIPLFGSASFHAGDMRSVFKSRIKEKVGAFFSNRVLHLLAEADLRDATRTAIGYLEQVALFCVSGRSPDDFDTALMEWVPGKEHEVARYKDPARTGHDIAFVTKQRFLRTIGHDLKDMHYYNAVEPERVGASDTHLLILLGRTRVEHRTSPCSWQSGGSTIATPPFSDQE
jgi:SAM-dependent methyltransferase